MAVREKIYNYYVTYSFTSNDGNGVGRSFIRSKTLLDTQEKIIEIENVLKEDNENQHAGTTGLFLLSWVLIKG
jgi:hypothetical protein